ncbi:uncharacterized protein LOC126316980 [Schistocerca gregaria]|uniref:uncharacterized protein LOC126316980 n=1 Tax=Schistocerca gregaria TaxID=7010 RepID=UPI00211EA336|nr:uncharacterized protein LOC126316980 [Schistocerca gregaria]
MESAKENYENLSNMIALARSETERKKTRGMSSNRRVSFSSSTQIHHYNQDGYLVSPESELERRFFAPTTPRRPEEQICASEKRGEESFPSEHLDADRGENSKRRSSREQTPSVKKKSKSVLSPFGGCVSPIRAALCGSRRDGRPGLFRGAGAELDEVAADSLQSGASRLNSGQRLYRQGYADKEMSAVYSSTNLNYQSYFDEAFKPEPVAQQRSEDRDDFTLMSTRRYPQSMDETRSNWGGILSTRAQDASNGCGGPGEGLGAGTEREVYLEYGEDDRTLDRRASQSGHSRSSWTMDVTMTDVGKIMAIADDGSDGLPDMSQERRGRLKSGSEKGIERRFLQVGSDGHEELDKLVRGGLDDCCVCPMEEEEQSDDGRGFSFDGRGLVNKSLSKFCGEASFRVGKGRDAPSSRGGLDGNHTLVFGLGNEMEETRSDFGQILARPFSDTTGVEENLTSSVQDKSLKPFSSKLSPCKPLPGDDLDLQNKTRRMSLFRSNKEPRPFSELEQQRGGLSVESLSGQESQSVGKGRASSLELDKLQFVSTNYSQDVGARKLESLCSNQEAVEIESSTSSSVPSHTVRINPSHSLTETLKSSVCNFTPLADGRARESGASSRRSADRSVVGKELSAGGGARRGAPGESEFFGDVVRVDELKKEVGRGDLPAPDCRQDEETGRSGGFLTESNRSARRGGESDAKWQEIEEGAKLPAFEEDAPEFLWKEETRDFRTEDSVLTQTGLNREEQLSMSMSWNNGSSLYELTGMHGARLRQFLSEDTRYLAHLDDPKEGELSNEKLLFQLKHLKDESGGAAPAEATQQPLKKSALLELLERLRENVREEGVSRGEQDDQYLDFLTESCQKEEDRQLFDEPAEMTMTGQQQDLDKLMASTPTILRTPYQSESIGAGTSVPPERSRGESFGLKWCEMTWTKFLSQLGIHFLDTTMYRRPSIGVRVSVPKTDYDRLCTIFRSDPELKLYGDWYRELEETSRESEDRVSEMDERCRRLCMESDGRMREFLTDVLRRHGSRQDFGQLKRLCQLVAKIRLHDKVLGRSIEQRIQAMLQNSLSSARECLSRVESSLNEVDRSVFDDQNLTLTLLNSTRMADETNMSIQRLLASPLVSQSGTLDDCVTERCGHATLRLKANVEFVSRIESLLSQIRQLSNQEDFLASGLGWHLIHSNEVRNVRLCFTCQQAIHIEFLLADHSVALPLPSSSFCDPDYLSNPCRLQSIRLHCVLSPERIFDYSVVSKLLESYSSFYPCPAYLTFQVISDTLTLVGRILDLIRELHQLDTWLLFSPAISESRLLPIPGVRFGIRFSNAVTCRAFLVEFELGCDYPFLSLLPFEMHNPFKVPITSDQVGSVILEEIEKCTFQPLSRICRRLAGLC